MARGSKLVMVPTSQAYPEYRSWWEARKLSPPPPPNCGIFIGHIEHGLILGSCVYMTDGPFIFIEHSSVSPRLRRLWKPAGLMMLREFRRLAVSMGKFPVAFPDRKSIAKICEEAGFHRSGAVVMVAPMVST